MLVSFLSCPLSLVLLFLLDLFGLLLFLPQSDPYRSSSCLNKRLDDHLCVACGKRRGERERERKREREREGGERTLLIILRSAINVNKYSFLTLFQLQL